MRQQRLANAVAMLAIALIAACANNGGMRDADKLALYRAHAGAPVASFRYFGSINGWTPLGDNAIAVWTRPSQAYLLDLGGACPDIATAHAISLTEQMGTVSARFDKVIARGPGATMQIPCAIREIRPLDTKAIRQAERQARADQASGT